MREIYFVVEDARDSDGEVVKMVKERQDVESGVADFESRLLESLLLVIEAVGKVDSRRLLIFFAW